MATNASINNSSDPLLVSAGQVGGVTAVNKFGHAPDGVQLTLTDIWGRADSVPTQQIWLAPTAARVHAIVSSSASDVSGGSGATSVIVYGLTSWSTSETSETVVLNGTTPVNTVNSYVIIHRLKCVQQATSTSTNVGTITATAAVNSTVTAVVLAGKGQTQLAVYGVPSTQSLYMTNWNVDLHDITGGAGAKITAFLVANESPNIQTTAFLVKHNTGCNTNGNSNSFHSFNPYFKISGPAIVKVQAIGTTADLDVSAGFDGFLVNN